MGKAEWRKRKREREQRLIKEERRKYGKARYVIEANLSCGCCSVTMHFASKRSATEAFHKAGLSSFGTITDDAGETHTDVDTFYGFRVKEEAPRSIPYLLNVLTGKKSWP